MTIVSVGIHDQLTDGRQSARALMVRRGVCAFLENLLHTPLPELPLPNGRRADLVSISAGGEIWIIEIKSSIEDFRVDNKWPDYRAWCDRLFFATHPEVPREIFPADCGLILSDGYDAHLLREAPEHRLAAPRRKSLTLDVARTASRRLLLASRVHSDIMP